MIFAPLAFLSVSALVAANELDDIINDFTKISPSDSAAFTSWRSAYGNGLKSYATSNFNENVAHETSVVDVASLKNSLISVADSEMTESYGYFSNAYFATQTSDDYDFATDAYATGDDYETAFETGDDCEAARPTDDDFETTFQTDQSPAPTTAISDSLDYDEYTATASDYAPMSADTSNPVLKRALTDNVYELAASSNKSSSSTHSSGSGSASHSGSGSSSRSSSGSSSRSASGSSSRASSSHSGLGEHQAPMVVGAVLAGLSVLLL